MYQHNLDALIATTKENIRYFTGFDPVCKTLNPYYAQSYAVITQESQQKVHYVGPIGEIDQILDANVKIGEVETFGVFYRENLGCNGMSENETRLELLSDINKSSQQAVDALQSLLKKLNVMNGRIGIDLDGIDPELFLQIKKKLLKVLWVPSSRIIRKIRAVKTPQEIALLTKSAQINEKAINRVIEHLKIGINEVEIARIFEILVVEQGARPALTMMKLGRAAVGGQMRQRADVCLKQNDIVWFDNDTIFNGYWSDIARTHFFGEISPIVLAKYQALLEGQRYAISQIRAGMSGAQVFELTMRAVHEAGFKHYRRHHVGHGIGLEPYEFPILAPSNEDYIEEGMVLSVETPYYEFGLGALHVEDPILIGKNGNIQLTLGAGDLSNE